MYRSIKSAKELPVEWDQLTSDNLYMSKSFLCFMERVNPCNQSYHLFYQEDRLYSCFLMFERKFNLLIFTDRFKLTCNMKFIYLPLSVSHPSIVFSTDMSEVDGVLNKMKGIKIIINTKQNEVLKHFAQGDYLPICILENKWKSFEEYLKSMRSNHRRRINQALKKGEEIQCEWLKDNREFTDEMYELYEQVLNNSTYSLEKLEKEFFQNEISKTMILKVKGNIEAFIQIIEDRKNDMLIFEFCGYNYEAAHLYDLYWNMLIQITKYSIDNHFRYLQYGQTAYDAKLKFGATMHYNYFLLSHSNRFINKLIQKSIRFMQYKVKLYDFNVFRGDTNHEDNAGKTKTS